MAERIVTTGATSTIAVSTQMNDREIIGPDRTDEDNGG